MHVADHATFPEAEAAFPEILPATLNALVKVQRLEPRSDGGGCVEANDWTFMGPVEGSFETSLDWTRFRMSSGQPARLARAGVSTAVALGFAPEPRRFPGASVLPTSSWTSAHRTSALRLVSSLHGNT